MSGPASNLERLLALEKTVATQQARIEKLERMSGSLAAVFGGGTLTAPEASDRELDGVHGNGEVKFIPRGAHDMGVAKGTKFSRCPPEFLDLLAEAFDFFAEENDAKGEKDARGNPKSRWDRSGARLARGWARRIRAGWTPPPAPTFSAPAGATGAAKPAPFGSSAGQSNGPRGFGGAAPPAAPLPSPSADLPVSDNDFPYGANAEPKLTQDDYGAQAAADAAVAKCEAGPDLDEDDDDEPPLA